MIEAYLRRLENLYIRLLWIHRASAIKFKVNCPPQCTEGHTYKWPCKQRIRKPKKSNVGAWRDDYQLDIVMKPDLPEDTFQLIKKKVNRCIFCGATDTPMWWKCCRNHTTEQGPDVVCDSCAHEKHPDGLKGSG